MNKVAFFLMILFMSPIADVFGQDVLIYIIGDNVNIRSTPSVSAPIVKKVEGYTDFIVKETGLKEKINGNTDYWYKVKNNDTEGWVFGHFTSLKQAGRKSMVLKFTKYEHPDLDYPGMFTFEDTNAKVFYLSSWAMPPDSIKLTLDNNGAQEKPNPEFLGKHFKLILNFLPYKFDNPSDDSSNILEHWVCLEITEIK